MVLLLGGARSGKSRLAVSLARRSGAPVVFVATGSAGDAEMEERIARHRAERPASWRTVEAPVDLRGAIAGAEPGSCVIADCLAFWVANVLGTADVEAQARACASAAAERDGLVIAVSNEVGMGVVPATPLGREFRDVLGRVNAVWAEHADEAYLVVAGRTLPLERP